MASKYVDTSSIIQVIGNVYKNPGLLDLTDKYMLTEEDFPEKFHQIVFGTIYKLHELGATHITISSILDFLSSRPKNEAIFKQQKGEEWLLRVSENITPNAFDYYYGRLKKFSLLRAYESFGIDVSDIYDPDNILDPKKRQTQEEQLDNCTLQQIAEKIDGKIDQIKLRYVEDVLDEAQQAGEGIFDLIESFKQNPEVGVPLYGTLINTVTRGARLKKFYLRSAPTGYGKAIPNYVRIPTPDGWRRVDSIKVGDYLFDAHGQPTRVTGVFPQPEDKEIWTVCFDDGREAQCCKDHLWEYSDEREEIQVKSLEEICNDVLKRFPKEQNFIPNNEVNFPLSDLNSRYKVRTNDAINYSEKDLPIDPFLLGYILGGSYDLLTEDKIFISWKKNEVLDRLEKILHATKEKFMIINGDIEGYRFKKNDTYITTQEIVKAYPELYVMQRNFFIPDEYLQGSITQRWHLLQGLIQGYDQPYNKDKRAFSFSTSSPTLLTNITELLRSLGIYSFFSSNLKLHCHKIDWDNYPPYEMSISVIPKIKDYLFFGDESSPIPQEKSSLFSVIIRVVKSTIKMPMTCFTVDNDEHLFLMNDFIVTHNTRSMIADACYIACNKIYDDVFGWINSGPCEPTLYITTEQEVSEIQTMMLAFLSNVNEEHIINGRYVGDEEERVNQAARILNDAPLYIEELPDFSLMDIENKIKHNLREHDIKYVFHDYIHTSIKILEEITRRSGGVRLREDNILFMLSTKLKDLCNTYGIFIMSATQLSGDYNDSETPDQTLLRGAKSIADKIDFGCVLLGVRERDLNNLENILTNGGFEKPSLKLSIYKNRRGRYKGIYLWCKTDLGTCRINPIFATGWDYELIPIDDTKINISAFREGE